MNKTSLHAICTLGPVYMPPIGKQELRSINSCDLLISTNFSLNFDNGFMINNCRAFIPPHDLFKEATGITVEWSWWPLNIYVICIVCLIVLLLYLLNIVCKIWLSSSLWQEERLPCQTCNNLWLLSWLKVNFRLVRTRIKARWFVNVLQCNSNCTHVHSYYL